MEPRPADTAIIQAQWLSTNLDDLAIDTSLACLIQRILDANVHFHLSLDVWKPARDASQVILLVPKSILRQACIAYFSRARSHFTRYDTV